MFLIRSIQAELIKLKYLPILWLCATVVFAILLVVFTSHYIDVNSVATLGRSPWLKIKTASAAIFSVFMIIPFVVLFISAAVYIEHQAKGWKQQYTVSTSRAAVFFSKLLSLLLVILITLFILIIGLIACAYLLNFLLPELEFNYYKIPIFIFFKTLAHTFLATLGVIGIQYFLSLRFKGFLIPAGFGIVAFIIGIILGSVNNPLAVYYPYSYPIIAQDYGMFIRDKIGVVEYGWINNVEMYSILIFLVFILFACILETRKNVID